MTALKIITIILFVLLTIVTVKIHPEMHQPMRIEPANFKLVRESDLLNYKEQMPIAKAASEPKQIEIKTEEPASSQTKYANTYSNPVQEKEKIVYNPPSPKKTQTQTQQNDDTMNQLEMLQHLLNQVEQQEQQQPAEPPKTAQQKPAVPKPVQTQKPKTTFNNPYMSEQEEIIAWNKWRSDIQNKIMVDSKIDYAPLGTMFLFSCVVDKYGNVSNIKAWSSNPSFSSVAKNNVKPAIANLQGKPILRFPRGTQRTTTVFNGAFLIGIEDRFSTPGDYADFERIMRSGQ